MYSLCNALDFCVSIVYYSKEESFLKQRQLIKKLKKIGFQFERHGGNHDIYRRGSDIEQIPRHKEINEELAKAILRKWGI